jgi:hypothetical protein
MPFAFLFLLLFLIYLFGGADYHELQNFESFTVLSNQSLVNTFHKTLLSSEYLLGPSCSKSNSALPLLLKVELHSTFVSCR